MATVTIPKKLTRETKTFIVQAIYEVLSDPDFGLTLSEKAKRRLRQSLSLNKRTASFSAIKQRYY